MEREKYSNLLKDPRWQKKRLEIFQRDDFTCQKCNDKESTLHIHHKKYIQGNLPWEYENDDLLTVCENCHFIISIYKKYDISQLIIKKVLEVETSFNLFLVKTPENFLVLRIDKTIPWSFLIRFQINLKDLKLFINK